MNVMVMPAAMPRLDSRLSFDGLTLPDDGIGLFDFPPSLDDWVCDKKVCQYFNAGDEAETCGADPEYFIRASHCWDPGCHEAHTWYYCLRIYYIFSMILTSIILMEVLCLSGASMNCR
ncbi:hypothetical protein [Bifidobacterium simiiventris]|uniref:hypothetical protein n=1 Tax=Bifidobacterium simiiventris TaxID=2834434 RepID=UPI001C571868|nr:hypothetical protein [Bifidobacterium simiiventris]MBW3079077.1 hypothetical protein [Bifidobacterium simiiventris]